MNNNIILSDASILLKRRSLNELIREIIKFDFFYSDMKNEIEDASYYLCNEGNTAIVIELLISLVDFYDNLEDKNSEIMNALSDLYLLIGDVYQSNDDFESSITWYKKSFLINNYYDVPVHSLAGSYEKLGDTAMVIHSLKKEISISPGNYFSYLWLAQIYEEQEQFDDVEQILQELLLRDIENIQGLHMLIVFYEKYKPDLDIELLRHRIITADKTLVKLDLVIWVYHMCRKERFYDALAFLVEEDRGIYGVSIIKLLKAYIYGVTNQYVKKRHELTEFRTLNYGRKEFMKTTINEFKKVFGSHASDTFFKRLLTTKFIQR